MVEIQVARLQYPHDLNTFRRFPMEGNGGLLDDLLDESLQGVLVHVEIPAVDQSVDAVY